MEKADSILIVDDDPEIRRLLADYLARNGFEALAARDGREMWQTLDRHVVDLRLDEAMARVASVLQTPADARASLRERASR